MSSYEEIRPRELKPALLELDGISRASVEAHYKLYQGYVNKRNEILGKLGGADLGSANQIYSELRALKVELSFAVGGIKNHEVYFEHLGGAGGDPKGAVADLIKRDFGSAQAWRDDLKATGMGGRGWAWTAYDWDEGRLFNYIGDAQNTLSDLERDPARRARRLRARVLPRLPDRPRRLHRRLLRQPGLGRRERLGLEVPDPAADSAMTAVLVVLGGYLLGSMPFGYWVVLLLKGEDIRKVGSGNIGATNVWRTYGRRYGIPIVLLDVAKGFVPALVGTLLVGELVGVLAGGAAMLGHWRPLFLGFQKGGKTVATGGRDVLRRRAAARR